MAEEVRCLPNNHEAKLQVVEVRQKKLSLNVLFTSLSPSLPVLQLQIFSLCRLPHPEKNILVFVLIEVIIFYQYR